jgi:hypothetical protein
MLPQLQKGILRNILCGLRVAQVATQELSKARSVLAVKLSKRFCVTPPQSVPQVLSIFHRCHGSYLLFVSAAPTVHCAMSGSSQ